MSFKCLTNIKHAEASRPTESSGATGSPDAWPTAARTGHAAAHAATSTRHATACAWHATARAWHATACACHATAGACHAAGDGRRQLSAWELRFSLKALGVGATLRLLGCRGCEVWLDDLFAARRGTRHAQHHRFCIRPFSPC